MENPVSQFNFNELRIVKNDGFFGVTLPVMFVVQGAAAATALNYTAPFFIAQRDYYVISVTERHEVAGSHGDPVTMMLKKVASGTAPASGTDMLTAGLSLKSTANTNQNGSLVITAGGLTIPRGYALSFVTSGTLTAVQGVTASVILKAV
jgi:hypothetical protein